LQRPAAGNGSRLKAGMTKTKAGMTKTKAGMTKTKAVMTKTKAGSTVQGKSLFTSAMGD
jgi:hypothetical protein